MSRLRSWLGKRVNTSPANAASWLIALVILLVAIPANDKIGRNWFFFVAHGLSPVVWVVELLVLVALTWLLVWAVLTIVRRRATARGYDIVVSAVTFVVVWFLAGNALSLSVFANLAWLGPIIGLLAAAVVTWLARRFAMGTALLVVSAVAAAVPVASTALQEHTSPIIPYAYASASRPNVVWVVSDELPYYLTSTKDGTVRDFMPNLKELQSQATTYTRAYGLANFTDYAVPSMLTGVTDVASIEPDRMREIRANVGIVPGFSGEYSIVFESPMFGFGCENEACARAGANPEAGSVQRLWDFTRDVVAISARTVLAAPFVDAFPSLEGKWRDFWEGGDEFGADAKVDTVGKVINGITTSVERNPDMPFFAFWHSIRTHGPYPLDRQGRLIFPARVPIVPDGHMVGSRKNETKATDELIAMDRRLNVNVAIAMDRQLGELMDTLKRLGVYDNTMVVFTADHGAAATKVRTRRIGDTDVQRWSEIAHVPLIVKEAGQVEPRIVTEPRTTGQIARTVLEQTGAKIPEGVAPAAGLSTTLRPEDLAFAAVTVKGPSRWPFRDIAEVDPWRPEDLDPPDPAHPFAIGIDLSLLDKPVPPGAKQQPAELTVMSGDSEQRLIVAERDGPACGAHSVGLVSGGTPETVIGSVLWEGDEGSRGWAIVPAADRYRLWCVPNPGAVQPVG